MTTEKPRRPAARKAADTTPKRARPATRKATPRPAPAKAKAKVAAKKTGRQKAARAAIVEVVLGALEDLKAQNVITLDVRELTTVTDTIVIASGTSDRHVKSLAGSVLAKAAEAGYRTLGREGERDGEWVLVDLSDVIVHVMLPRVREFYGLEKLWDVRSGERAGGA